MVTNINSNSSQQKIILFINAKETASYYSLIKEYEKEFSLKDIQKLDSFEKFNSIK